MKLVEYMELQRQKVDRALAIGLPPEIGPAKTLHAAVRYAVLGGGKRLRPILVMASYESLVGNADGIVGAACALELIHSYSLIHDDLPSMDNDDLRRGRPTTHKKFGEAIGILAGDSAQALAFEWLASQPAGASFAPLRAEAVRVLAQDSGALGMVGGQIADLEAETDPADLVRLRWIHRHKTGALFSASAEIGAILAGADAETRLALREYGDRLGMAFQIADDLLDRSGSAADLGKTPGKDFASGKSTFPSLLGEAGSKDAARVEVELAREALTRIGLAGSVLADLAVFSIERTH